MPHSLAIRVAATISLLLAVTFVVLINWCALEWTGWFEPVAACIWGGFSVLTISHLALISRRFVLVPPGGMIALSAVLLALIWTNPLSPRTRFFADTTQIEVGMTINEARTRLPQYPMACNTVPGYISPEAMAVTTYGFAPHFTGYVLCSPTSHSSDCTRLDVKDGIITNICRYVDD